MRTVLEDFKRFLLQSNLVTLAVAFVFGAVFAALMKAFIGDLVTPIIGVIVGEPDFGTLSFTINGSHFLYGDFINALFTFVTTAAAVFFFVVKPYEAWNARRPEEEAPAPAVKTCPECTSEIPEAARRCPQCTAVLITA